MPHSSVNQNTYRLKHTLGSPSWTAKPQFCVVKGMRLQLPTISFIESRTADNHANSKYRNLLKNSLVSCSPQLIHYASKLQKHKSPHLVRKRVWATMITQPFSTGKILHLLPYYAWYWAIKNYMVHGFNFSFTKLTEVISRRNSPSRKSVFSGQLPFA